MDRVLPELLDFTDDQHVPGNASGFGDVQGRRGGLQGSALQGSVSLGSQFVRCLSRAPLCPTFAFLHTLLLQCVFPSPVQAVKLLSTFGKAS